MKTSTASGVPIIDFFDDEEHGFLSNFFPSEVVLTTDWQYGDLDEGADITCPTVEHAYQAAKATSLGDVIEISTQATPGRAKRCGRRTTLRPDWVHVRVPLMRELVWQKFEHPDLQLRLQATAPALLVEGNTWGDRYWGVCDGQGLNWLGLILMEVRNLTRRSM